MRLSHARPCQHTRPLQIRRRRDHHHRIHLRRGSGLKQQRNIQNHDIRLAVGNVIRPVACHQRMHHGFNPGQGAFVHGDPALQRRA